MDKKRTAYVFPTIWGRLQFSGIKLTGIDKQSVSGWNYASIDEAVHYAKIMGFTHYQLCGVDGNEWGNPIEIVTDE